MLKPRNRIAGIPSADLRRRRNDMKCSDEKQFEKQMQTALSQ
jgi:hypothetical protein